MYYICTVPKQLFIFLLSICRTNKFSFEVSGKHYADNVFLILWKLVTNDNWLDLKTSTSKVPHKIYQSFMEQSKIYEVSPGVSPGIPPPHTQLVQIGSRRQSEWQRAGEGAQRIASRLKGKGRIVASASPMSSSQVWES